MIDLDTARRRWHPIAAAHDLPYRHVYHGQLLGQEMAVWRADDGFVNIWENRCLHRGVRLSIGVNDGRELKCQYHGWRYANRTAGCTYIPAHPADAPARTITNRTFPSVERYGLVWTALEAGADFPELEGSAGDVPLALRGIPVNAPADLVLEHLLGYRFVPTDEIAAAGDAESDGGVEISRAEGPAFSVILGARRSGGQTMAVFFVQPLDSGRSVIRGVLDAAPSHRAARIAVLRHHNRRLGALRDAAERAAAEQHAPEPIVPGYEPVPPELADVPERTPSGRSAALRAVVARKWQTGADVAGIELRATKGFLPTFQPGAHIDVHLPNGLVRQYSVVNGPGETEAYVIGVKREPESAGGSSCLHETVREGDVLAISSPRNNFSLRRDADRTILVAGGIGITPLLAMAQALAHSGLAFELHLFARSEAHLPFPERLAALGEAFRANFGRSAAETEADLRVLLGGYRPGLHLYLCGPGPMLETARAIAAAAGWPEPAVHFEYFKNTREIDDSSNFEVALARSALTLQVPAGRTILDVVREAGVDIPSSCEQGACGTCIATVIEGEPDHQDVYLGEAERREGRKIITCVSRARSGRLVLDV